MELLIGHGARLAGEAGGDKVEGLDGRLDRPYRAAETLPKLCREKPREVPGDTLVWPFGPGGVNLFPAAAEGLDELDGGLLAGGFGLGEGALFGEVFALGVDDFEKADKAGFVAEFDEA